MHRIFLLFFLMASVFCFPQGKFSGYMFGDFYWINENHNKELNDQNGFWFRRIYFTYDYKISEKFFTRFRLELNSPGDFKTKANLEPYAKDAYLGFDYKSGKAYFGISPTPTWEFIENFWGYRAVEKTPADLYKDRSSRDFGFAFKGSFSKFLSYHLLIANGEGTKSETNKQKTIYFSFLFKKGAFNLEFYTDYAKGKNDLNDYIYQGFLGIKKERFTLGFQYYKHTFEKEEGDLEIDVFSFIFNLNFGEKYTLLLRTDKMDDPNPFIGTQSYTPFSTTNPFILYLIGFDFKVLKNISIIPNFEFVRYEKYNETKPKSDSYFKLTFFYSF